MGGKKKKSLANKLSKMSDEERARYLQHRAEIEEEAKRRKEQLIATFMKKKIKKEDAFSRLNMSKINQNWHQLLRKIKVKEMKEEVGHLKRWIERVLDYKNRQIAKLMEELEEAEEQYLNNFNSHSVHLDKIIEDQNGYIDKLQLQYQEELSDLLDQAQQEENSIVEHSNSEVTYLKTVIFGQENKSAKELRDSWEYYSKQLFEIEYNNRIKLRHLRKTRGETESALWRQMLQIVRFYVQKTDVRRSHLQELRRLDAESADEIRKNEERITKEEELIKLLNTNYEDLLKSRTEKCRCLDAEEKELKIKFIKVRSTLKKDLALDENQLRFLTAISNEALDHLSALFGKGEHILFLSNTCRKFETEREKVSKWLPVMNIYEISDDSLVEEKDTCTENQKTGDGLTDDEKLYQKALEKGFSLPKLKDDLITETAAKEQKPRPKTSVPCRLIKSATSATDQDSAEYVSTPEIKKITPIEEIKIEVKKTDDKMENETTFSNCLNDKSLEGEKDFLWRCYENLEKMENFWVAYNKVEIDVMELKKEKNVLEKENKQLRGLIRAVLEAAALAKSIPDSRVSTRVPSKRRSAYSAPLHRIVLN